MWGAAPRSCHDRTESVWRPCGNSLGMETRTGPHVKDGRRAGGMSAMTHRQTAEADAKPRIKKSETLEVRIPYETKQAFLTACREDGTTASEVVREQVQTYLDARERPPPQEKKDARHEIPRNRSPLWPARRRRQSRRHWPHRAGRAAQRRRAGLQGPVRAASTSTAMACCRSTSSLAPRPRATAKSKQCRHRDAHHHAQRR